MNLQRLRERQEIPGDVVREVDPKRSLRIVHRFDDIDDLDAARLRFGSKGRAHHRRLLHRRSLGSWGLFKCNHVLSQRRGGV